MLHIAYVYMTHRDPELLRRFSKYVSQGGIFVHVDAKCDIAPFREICSDCENVFFLTDRIETYWGDFSYVKAEVRALREALRSSVGYERFVVIQGADYPIVSENEIINFFDRNRAVNFINAANCLACGPLEMNKYRMKHKLSTKSFVNRILRRVNTRLSFRVGHGLWSKKAYVLLADGSRLDLYSGWAQFSVNREVAEYFVDFHDEHPEFSSYFETVYAADESYFQTIFYNSSLQNTGFMPEPLTKRDQTALLNNTYFEYPVLVREFVEPEEYDYLLSTGKLFFRKVSSADGKVLLDRIDFECLT